ncbi:MAG: peptide-methionine (S)-S-oxide reductase MsrA, partial [Proteobacteria bacterium]|nr:peptide-methionine (S)-S-oxide reductase MsrA [Pseudomonadota bacterium]
MKSNIFHSDQNLPGRDEAIVISDPHFVNGASITPPFPEGSHQAIFGLGCFWGAERCFWKLDGVISTAVGYAGGSTKNPTYHEVCSGMTGHTEAVLVIYDPQHISYQKLLMVFLESHNPTQGMRQGNDVGTQYRSAIYTRNDAETEIAKTTLSHYEVLLQKS